MNRSTTTEYYRERSRRWREGNRERHRELARNWYARNKAKAQAKAQARRAILDAYRRESGCVDCGTAEGWLDFDHRPGEVKSFTVAEGLGRSWETLWAEIARCDIRCRSCHNKRHGPGRRGIPKRPKAKR